jgi:hypothetical protein
MKRKLALLILAASTLLGAPSSANARCVYFETVCEDTLMCSPCSDEYYVYNCGGGKYLYLFVGCCGCT